jgi:hypothetical protein
VRPEIERVLEKAEITIEDLKALNLSADECAESSVSVRTKRKEDDDVQ